VYVCMYVLCVAKGGKNVDRIKYLVILGPVRPIDQLHEHAGQLTFTTRRCRGYENIDNFLYGSFLRRRNWHF
jgi:hypothetical protein